jgi:RIP metalloprotease RseP
MAALILILGVISMVILHEGAHFVAAKSFNMKATEAFFGFGPRLWSMQRGETEYGVKAIPLGGYVRIIGMNPFEEVAPEDEARTYRKNPFWKKSVVVLAGIASHFIVAFLIFYVLALVYGVIEPSSEVKVVQPVLFTPVEDVAEDQPLELLSGDELVTIDGRSVYDAAGNVVFVGDNKAPGELTVVVVDRDGELITLETTDVPSPTPASASGVIPGDVLVEMAGETIVVWYDFVDIAQGNPGETVTIVVERDGERIALETTLLAVGNPPRGFFGVSPLAVERSVGVFGATGEALSDIWFAAQQSVVGLWSLVTNFGGLLAAVFDSSSEVPEASRPVSVVGLTRIADASGIQATFVLLAFVNVFVGVLNFLPLYPLDGGHFAVAAYEKARGREPDVRKLLPVAAVVVAFVVLLGLLGIYFDIVDPLQLPG